MTYDPDVVGPRFDSGTECAMVVNMYKHHFRISSGESYHRAAERTGTVWLEHGPREHRCFRPRLLPGCLSYRTCSTQRQRSGNRDLRRERGTRLRFQGDERAIFTARNAGAEFTAAFEDELLNLPWSHRREVVHPLVA